jgi:hypothetical protein
LFLFSAAFESTGLDSLHEQLTCQRSKFEISYSPAIKHSTGFEKYGKLTNKDRGRERETERLKEREGEGGGRERERETKERSKFEISNFPIIKHSTGFEKYGKLTNKERGRERGETDRQTDRD